MSDLVMRAAVFAANSHAGQYRKYSNSFGVKEPFINHPARVVAALAAYKGTTETMMAAAWCHDVIEDCKVSVDTLVNATSPACAVLVEELTNPSKDFPELSRAGRKNMDCEYAKTMSREAKIIKMFDRMDNLIGLANAPDNFATLYLRESRTLLSALKDADTFIAEALSNLIYQIDCYRIPKVYI